jgi:DNA modification methylase
LGALADADPDTVKKWVSEKTNELEFSEPPASRQHFDIWQFPKADGESSYFGRMPPQVVENLLWFYTDPGSIVFDPFAGGDVPVGGHAPLPPTK